MILHSLKKICTSLMVFKIVKFYKPISRVTASRKKEDIFIIIQLIMYPLTNLYNCVCILLICTML